MGMSSRSQSSPGIDVQQVETLAANSGLEQSLSAPTADSLPPCRNLFQQVDLKPSQATSQNRSPSPDRFPPGLQEWRSYMVQTGDSLPSLVDPSLLLCPPRGTICPRLLGAIMRRVHRRPSSWDRR